MSKLPSAVEATVLAESAAGPGVEPPSSGEQLEAGVLLANRWELVALLGVGGMGSVYRARDRELDELVAVKVLRRELARAPQMLERFRREVKLARRVTHPNVARTFDIGEEGDLRFLTMELLDGAPLSRHATHGAAWPLSRLLPIATAVCAGLGAAHDAGVVHRDLKPDNVIVERSRRVVITDFGIARALGGEGASTESQGVVVGTPLYMAPEQVAHDAEIGPAADVYALGCMLFELVAGAPPWSGPTPLAVAAARLLAPPPDVRSVQRDVPESFARLLLAMMDRDPARRPASAAAVGAALATITPPTLVSPSLPPSSPGVSTTLTPRSGELSLASPTHWNAPRSVAVLPIENRGPDEDAYLAAALADDLADLLSASPGLRVRPRRVAARAAERHDDPRDAGRELDVQVVVTGDLRRQGDVVHATVRLVTVEDGFQLWAQRFSSDARDFMKVGDAAAAAIARALLARTASQRATPADPEALDLYMRGKFLLSRAWGATHHALEALGRAIERAPEDRRIRAAFALASIRGFAIGAVSAERVSVAQKIVDELLADDPRDVEALFARAQLHLTRGEAVAAAMSVRAALEVSPDDQASLALVGDVLGEIGEPDRARRALERARALEPTHFGPRISLTRVAALEGDVARALEILGPPPEDAFDREVYWLIRARYAMWFGSADEARLIREHFQTQTAPGLLREVALALTAPPLGLPLQDHLMVLARTGMDPRAGQRNAALHLQIRAEVLAAHGRLDDAITAFAGADGHATFDAFWVDRCRALGAIRHQGAFAEIRQRILARAERVRDALGDVPLGT